MLKKIVVIDDSALMRRVISDIINSDNRFEVVATANNGIDGLNWLKNNPKPHAVILDINMPKMNGLELLDQLKLHRINVNVVMVSTVAKQGAKETIDALEKGAFDFVTKPESFIDAKGEDFRQRLLQCIGIAVNANSSVAISKPISEPKKETIENPNRAAFLELVSRNRLQREEKRSKPIPTQEKVAKELPDYTKGRLIALCCSTGGPKSLQAVIPLLPSNLLAPILIVQHMPEGFTNSLAMRLNELSPLTVKEATNNEILQSGMVYIARGGSHLLLKRNAKNSYYLELNKEPAREGVRPSANNLYESLIDSDFDEIVCVVLTGMGGDGTAGIKKLNKHKKIYVIAQNEETSTVYGMPKAIKENGLVDEVLPLTEIAEAIQRRVGVH